ncbi:b7f89f1c-61f9-4a56-8111-d68300982863 [Thermothielavioides terrestris]|uniref:B7f89f1c-61f9-4a56-8111-d68300982863 n=1 Tax=Thermothielavioides terrestris TaxID=2587410 RepID=A0A446BNL8_9PEZI|nr:b7f89f1c-61f9-4a56-8111-d68300982863 [Thermothielavioides terrestris]
MVTTPNQGPATRLFTPPASCVSTTTYTTEISGTPTGFTLGTDLDCFPPPTSALVSPATSFVKLYSPGICPVGYNYAGPFTWSISGRNYDDSVTRYICCPGSYSTFYYSFYENQICVVATSFVPYATAAAGTLPPHTALTALMYAEADNRVTASPIIVAWRDRDQEVLDALAEDGVSVRWPPAEAARKTKIILLSVLIPVGVILLAGVAWLYRLRKKGRLRGGPSWLRGVGPRGHGRQHADAPDDAVLKPELHAESRRLSCAAEPGPHEAPGEPAAAREADSRQVLPPAEADGSPASGRSEPAAELPGENAPRATAGPVIV